MDDGMNELIIQILEVKIKKLKFYSFKYHDSNSHIQSNRVKAALKHFKELIKK